MFRTVLQNAIYVPSTDNYHVSVHRHDFKVVSILNYGEVIVDGGLEYIRRSYSTNVIPHFKEFSLYTDDSFTEEIVPKLLWGTRGKDGKQPVKYVPLNSLETDHLESILKNCSSYITDPHLFTIVYILKQRKQE